MDENSAVSADVVGLNLVYANGPLTATAAYQLENGLVDTKFTRLSASYDFGSFVLKGNYGAYDQGTDDGTDYSFGVDVPLTSALTLSAAYAKGKVEVAGLTDSKKDGFGISAAYALSKRTMVYAGVINADSEDGAGVKDGDFRLYAVGVNHKF